ncbi:unnamed protein product [Didymodactylos carnosus]|uniref:Uncharacterized protein n=1 Tax=Didymodactylos carnosus TaxID=1234261 RepID=A0A8S2RB85_9BILA|nr:unnamed protein product [Didymodactylos carnosus]CAF4154087.1 unnamed protein product [Didymodactylos carnosus]
MATSLSSLQCEINGCKRGAVALCLHCSNHICTKHFQEHTQMINQQLHPLIDQLNKLSNKINYLTIADVIDPQQNLEKWRSESHRLIDEIYEKKRCEIEKLIEQDFIKQKNEQMKTIIDLKQKLKIWSDENETTSNEVRIIKQTLEDTEASLLYFQKMFVQIETKPLIIDPDFVFVQTRFITKQQPVHDVSFHLENLKCTNVKTLPIDISEWRLRYCANEEHVLVYNGTSHLYLYDTDLNFIKRRKIKDSYYMDHFERYDVIDMCWCESLKKILLLTDNHLLEFALSNDRIEVIHTVKRQHNFDFSSNFYRCTCSNESLYISYPNGLPLIDEYDLSTFDFLKQWTSPQTCDANAWIESIRCNYSKKQLGLSIMKAREQRIDLREIKTMNFVWSTRIEDVKYLRGLYPLRNNEWFVIESSDDGILFHIHADGTLTSKVKYNGKKRRPILLFN